MKTAPGWYLDGNGHSRWWNGVRWTHHVLPAGPGTPPPFEIDDAKPAAVEVPGSELQSQVFLVPTKRIAMLGLGCGAFTVCGIWMVFTAGVIEKYLAVICILIFGVVGGIAIRQFMVDRVALRLEPGGIRTRGGGIIPWSNIEKVGMARAPFVGTKTEFIGIRLTSQVDYLKSLSPHHVRQLMWTARLGRATGFALLPAKGASDVVEAVLTRDFKKLINDDLISFPHQGVAAQMTWGRNRLEGYDLTLSPTIFDRPGPEIVEAIEKYRATVAELEE